MGYHHGKFHDSSICQFGYLRGGRNPPPPAQLTPQKPGMNRVKAHAGVITARNFKSCCTSNLAMPLKMTFLTENVAKALWFYKLAILPELVEKWYSRDHVPCPQIESIALEKNSEICCTCG